MKIFVGSIFALVFIAAGPGGLVRAAGPATESVEDFFGLDKSPSTSPAQDATQPTTAATSPPDSASPITAPASQPVAENHEPATLPAPVAHAKHPSTQVVKVTAPAAPAQAAAMKLIDEVFAGDIAEAKTAKQKSVLAMKFLKAAIDEQKDITGKYVLLSLSRDTAAGTGDLDLACEAIDQLDQQFLIDAPKMKWSAASVAAKQIRTLDDRKRFLTRVETLADELAKIDRYEIAAGLDDLALGIARQLDDPPGVRALTAHIHERAEVATAFEKVKDSLVTLGEDPDDPPANLAVGTFRCFMAGDWETGLPLLTRSSDPGLKAIASKELNAGDDDSLAVADAWWSLGDQQTSIAKQQIEVHASEWYVKAIPDLSGLTKAKAERRIASVESIPITHGRNINLLEMVNVKKDTVLGQWESGADGISVVSETVAQRLAIPVTCTGDYDLTMIFMRNGGDSGVSVAFPIGQARVEYALGTVSQLLLIDNLAKNETVTPLVIESGRKYTVQIQVRLAPDDNATITVKVDQRQVVRWKGKTNRLTMWRKMTLPYSHCFGLGAYRSRSTFSELTVQILTGQFVTIPRVPH